MTALGNGQRQSHEEKTEHQDWHVTERGQCAPCPTPRDWDLLETPYRFHRFLTKVEDYLRSTTPESPSNGLPVLRRLVRKLVLNSYWLRTQHPEPSPNQTAILNLYDEIGYPLTVQIETQTRDRSRFSRVLATTIPTMASRAIG